MEKQLNLYPNYNPLDFFTGNRITDINFEALLPQLFPDIKTFKEFNPIEEVWVNKTYCFYCHAKDEFPTMYFNENGFACYECGNRGNSIYLLYEVLNYTPEEIAEMLIRKKKINPDEEQLERILQEINDVSFNEVHNHFEGNSAFHPGTACIQLGNRESEKILTDYIRIRKYIWRDLPKEIKEFEKEIEEENKEKSNDLPF